MTAWPETDALLERLRTWLGQVRAESQAAATDLPQPLAGGAAEETGSDAKEAAAQVPASNVGLIDLVREFTVLRHEVKLQTKSARGLEEQTATALAALEEATRQFRAVEPQEAEAARRAALPLIESMADLDEALGRAQAVVESARGRLGELHEAFSRRLTELLAAQPAWQRWFCRSWHAGVRDLCQADADERRRIVDALAEGHTMVRKRLERAMAKEGLCRIATVGQPVDPHAMTVVEVVDGEGHAPGTVVEEIRPGYRWNDKVVRYAEVRAARHENRNAFAE